MLLVCAFTFVPIKEWNEVPIFDFTVMQEMDTTSIVLLTDEDQPSLLLVSLPGNFYIYQVVYNLELFPYYLLTNIYVFNSNNNLKFYFE